MLRTFVLLPFVDDAWINGDNAFFNFRQRFFSRKRKRCADLERYGGAEMVSKFGDSARWSKMLAFACSKNLLEYKADTRTYKFVYNAAAYDWLTLTLKAQSSVEAKYASLRPN